MYRCNTLYDLETTAKFWLLNLRGIRVSIDREATANAIEWCNQNCQLVWAWHHLPVLICDREIVQNFDFALYGIEPGSKSENVEDMIINALAEEMSRAIDEDILKTLGVKPSNYFWFDSKDEATLFKLTFGGQ